MSREVELGCEKLDFFRFRLFLNSSATDTVLVTLPSTAVETAIAQCASCYAMARGQCLRRLNTSIVLVVVHGLSCLFWVVSAVKPSLSHLLPPPAPLPNKQHCFCWHKATWSRSPSGDCKRTELPGRSIKKITFNYIVYCSVRFRLKGSAVASCVWRRIIQLFKFSNPPTLFDFSYCSWQVRCDSFWFFIVFVMFAACDLDQRWYCVIIIFQPLNSD